ncbi:MAG TPA: hypothetical protein VLF66_13430 [Thermoanaerobaculia bacterium]|nr:hypothetical protein [Thermoanaerobaculia bacterium]
MAYPRCNLCRLAPAALAVLLLGAPLAAQDIPAGDDVWATTGDGTTHIELGSADWEAICRTSGSAMQIQFKGIALDGQGDGSVVVTRLGDAVFGDDGLAYVDVQVTELAFGSVSTYSTPCGSLDFRVGLNGTQDTATMEIRREDTWGGHFFVDLPVDAVVQAIDPSTGRVVGRVLREGILDEPAGGTVWSYAPPANALDPGAPWHPGVNQNGQRVTIARQHEFPAEHAYKPVTYCGNVVSSAALAPSPICEAEPVIVN